MADPKTDVVPSGLTDRQFDNQLVEFHLNGSEVSTPRDGSLLDALREHLGVRSAKDGCSPQGQCGSCTVWVDGQARVSCVTPVTRVSGRRVTTIEGLPDAEAWAAAFVRHGASQCGFCTPGIVMRCAALDDRSAAATKKALLAHLCRCTGWQPIVEAVENFALDGVLPEIDPALSSQRAIIEGGATQRVGPEVVLGQAGFADDTAPRDSLVALRDATGAWVVGTSLAHARTLSGKVQGRRTTAPPTWPIPVPPGDWVRTLQTTWVEPAYLEPDASWCEPDGEPMAANSNGGDFGAKVTSEVAAVARSLAREHGQTVRVLSTREDVVRYGAKRPPLALGVAVDGSCAVQVARTDGVIEAIDAAAAHFGSAVTTTEVDVAGPPTSSSIRGAGWTEVAVALTSLQPGPTYQFEAPDGGRAAATLRNGELHIEVDGGSSLDAAVLRSYAIGAAHMAMGMVWSESVSVSDDGEPLDLTIRSFGILRAVDLPPIVVDVVDSDREPCRVSDAVFVAVATAAWAATGFAPRWPASRPAW